MGMIQKNDNSVIDAIVYSFVKSKGVQVILSKKIFRGLVTVYFFNWIGRDGVYFSLFAPCNSTSVVPNEFINLESGLSFTKQLEKCLKSFNSKEEWDEGHWLLKDASQFNIRLEKSLKYVNVPKGITVGRYTLIDSLPWIHPVLGATVWYLYNDEPTSITVWSDRLTTVKERDESFIEFVKALGIYELLKIEIIGGVTIPLLESFK